MPSPTTARTSTARTSTARRSALRRAAPLAAAAILAACAASPPPASAVTAGPPVTAAPTSTSSTSTTPPAATARPRTIYLSLSRDIVTMPSTVSAGTYYVQVRTTDARNGVTVVRPPSTLTPSTFYARYSAFYAAYNANQDPTAAMHRYRTSATFVGGASTTAGQVGAFAIRLNPGRYWFFSAGGSDPLSWAKGGSLRLNPAHVKVVTVVGSVTPAVAVPIAGVARFGIDWKASTSVVLPSALPRAGFLLAVGGPALAGGMWATRIVDGVTDTELHDGTCLADGLPPTKQCFYGPMFTIGGAVSPGASAWFYYRFPPGDYAVGSNDHNALFDHYFFMGMVQRVHVS